MKKDLGEEKETSHSANEGKKIKMGEWVLMLMFRKKPCLIMINENVRKTKWRDSF